MKDESNAGHRDRLKLRFLKGESLGQTDEAILELLLTYSLPQKDVLPIAKKLLVEFGNLPGVFSTSKDDLCKVNGVKDHSATLINLVDWIREHYPPAKAPKAPQRPKDTTQVLLFQPPEEGRDQEKFTETKKVVRESVAKNVARIFGKSVLKEAIAILPDLPKTESLSEIRDYIRRNLHYNAAETRRRYTNYILSRMFAAGHADKELLAFSARFRGTPELREVCFYRFCQAEPLMFNIIEDVLIPSIGFGRVPRGKIREYLAVRFPGSKSIVDCAKAIPEALTAGGLVKADAKNLNFSYREVPIPSFAFILHSEFPEPGMYDIAKIGNSRAIRTMLWNPDRILHSLYELRNLGLISKVSEIDNVRQFTTKWTLPRLVDHVVKDWKTS